MNQTAAKAWQSHKQKREAVPIIIRGAERAERCHVEWAKHSGSSRELAVAL